MLGSGTLGDPYIIQDVNDLQDMNLDLAAHYVLGNDIDASETLTWNDGEGFVPIGNFVDGPFTGSIDGAGYTISNLYENITFGPCGLFGMVNTVFTIKNIGLNAEIITNQMLSSILVGYSLADISIDNCHLSGSLTSAEMNAGGFVGNCDAAVEISNSSCQADIEGVAPIGGFVGAIIDKCTAVDTYFAGDITGNGEGGTAGFVTHPGEGSSFVRCSYRGTMYGVSHASGFVCSADRNFLFEDCFCIADISGGDYLAGFAPEMVTKTGQPAVFTRCFFVGTINGDEFLGSMIGDGDVATLDQCFAVGSLSAQGVAFAGGAFNEDRDSILSNCFARVDLTTVNPPASFCGGFAQGTKKSTFNNCYSAGIVPLGSPNNGGFCGYTISTKPSTFNACFYDTDVSGYSDTGKGEPKPTSWMKTQANFEAAGWDFTSIWFIDPSWNDGYPCFQWFRDNVLAGNYDTDTMTELASRGLIPAISPTVTAPTVTTLPVTGVS